MKIERERYGHILAGLYEGYFVKISDDTAETGGYYIYLINHLSAPTDGGDFWVQGQAGLDSFVESARWEIDWLAE